MTGCNSDILATETLSAEPLSKQFPLQEVADLLDASWLSYMQSLVDQLPTLDRYLAESRQITTASSADEFIQSQNDPATTEEVSLQQVLTEVEDTTIVEERLPNLLDALAKAPDIDLKSHGFSQLFSRDLPPLEESIPGVDSRGWRDQRELNCLLFKVGDAVFATPLIALGHILEVGSSGNQKISRIPNLPNWVAGRFHDSRYNTTVIDGYRSLLMRDESHDAPAYVISFGGGKWSITVDQVLKSTIVPVEKIQWRTSIKLRPWSIGVLTHEMCTLLDIPLILRALQFDLN